MADHHFFFFPFSLPFDLWTLPQVTRSRFAGACTHRGREIERACNDEEESAEGRGKEEGEMEGTPLQTVRMAELVHQSLAALRLLHDALLVVLPDAAAELVVVHRGPVLPLAPEPRHAHRVLDLEDPLAAVQPAYAGAVNARALQQLLQKLPQVDVASAVAHLATAVATITITAVTAALNGSAILVLVCTQKINGAQGVRDEKRNCICTDDMRERNAALSVSSCNSTLRRYVT